MKRSGPKTDPWGSPENSVATFDLLIPTLSAISDVEIQAKCFRQSLNEEVMINHVKRRTNV